MHIICTDGTTIQCQDFEATDSGVLFFQERRGRRESEEEDEEEDEERASGFVPITQLQFVLPDEMVQQAGAQPAGAPQGGVPPGAPGQGGAMTQQQMQQSPGPQRRSQGRPPGSGGR